VTGTIITGFDANDRPAFAATVPDDALPPGAVKLSGAPDVAAPGESCWPLTEADARAIVGWLPAGLSYFLETVSR
jgi:hypothetical protein